MSISNEQQNILDNLRVPIKSFRIFALEEVIRTGDSPEILSVLEEIRITEDDPECSMLISHAISAVQSRLTGTKEPQPVKVGNSTEFLSTWKEADDNMRMHIISNLPARLPKDLRSIGPELLEGSSPIIAARVIRTFSRNWPEDKFNLITNNIHSDSLVLKLAALRTMVHLKPELLLPDLPALLSSQDPEIKALAIRGLVKIDKEEALKHLQALLLSASATERLAGIQNCPFLPFDMVKPLLLKYFAAESNAELLTKAGWIIEMNPDIEVPFRLFEIAERSPAKKTNLVKKVLNEAVRLLDKSGILGNQFAAYTKKLQDWVNKRNALRYVRQVVAKLDEETVPPEIENNIIVTIKQPLFYETFKEALTWPISNRVKSRIYKYLGIPDPNALPLDQTQAAASTQKPQTLIEKAQNLSQLELLANLTPQQAKEKFNQILLMITHKDSSSDVKIAALQCLTRCRLSGAEDIAVRLIKHHDVALATAAVEYLGIVNPDCIFPYLGQCLKVSDVGMKSAALGILKNFDYNQAISYLRAMLYSNDKAQQNMAMECLNQFDFDLVRDMLTEFLCKDYPEPLLEAGLCHFAANPSADNVYSLYKIEQAHKGKIAEQAKSLREACPEPTEELASSITQTQTETASAPTQTKEEKEAELKERLRVEKEKKASKKPAYAYQAPSDTPERNSKDQLIAIWALICEFVSSRALPISIVAFIIIAPAVYYGFIYTPGGPKKVQSSGALSPVPQILEGIVKDVNKKAVTFESTTNQTFVFHPLKDGWKVPEIGAKIRIQLVPFRKYEDKNIIQAKVGKLGYMPIKKYSKKYSGDKAED